MKKLLARFKKQARPSELTMLASDSITIGIETGSPAITQAGLDLLQAVMQHERKL